VMHRIRVSRIISVAAVNGLAAAGGLELACACDFVVASERAMFADGHNKYGFLPAFGGTSLLPHKVGRATAAWLMAGGQLDATSALRAGLADAVVDDRMLDDEAQRFCELLASSPSDTIKQIKDFGTQLAEIDPGIERLAVAHHLFAGGYDPDRFKRRT